MGRNGANVEVDMAGASGKARREHSTPRARAHSAARQRADARHDARPEIDRRRR
jgi:hypothetical protein